MPALVIVDMQPTEFRAAKSPHLQQVVVAEVERYRRLGAPIIVVEYGVLPEKGSMGPTALAIRRALRGYTRTCRVLKYSNNGALVVDQALRGMTRGRKVRVCGVNTGACVFATAKGLKDLGYEVEAHALGVNSETEPRYRTGIKKLAQVATIRHHRRVGSLVGDNRGWLK